MSSDALMAVFPAEVLSKGSDMGKMKEFPRYNVVSVRVTDEEMQLLQYMRKTRKTTYSHLIRQALTRADFPASMIADDERLLALCSG